MTLEQGDPFENTHFAWLRHKLLGGHRKLGYEQVWQDFIGNNGQGLPIDIRGLDVPAEARRQRFMEGHYSMAISAFLLDRTAERMVGREGRRRSVEEYLEDIDNYASLINHLGSVCDMVGRIEEALKAGGEIHGHVVDLHRLRSNAIHASRIPMRLDDLDLRIPIISRKKDPLPGEWYEDANWLTVDLTQNYVYLSQFAEETRNELFEALNKAYPVIYRHAEKTFRKQKIEASQWPPPSSPPPEPCFSFTLNPPSGVNVPKRTDKG